MHVRDRAIATAYRSGQTQAEIGKLYGITKVRVGQILACLGVSRQDGGGHVKAEAAARVAYDLFITRRDAWSMACYGHSYDDHLRIRAAASVEHRRGVSRDRTQIGAFRRQRVNARNRGIEWSLTFPQWLDVWRKSEKWSERGRGNGKYVMCRCGDMGAYAVGNVFIQTSNDNSREAIVKYWRAKK